jgi:hypothetical protein
MLMPILPLARFAPDASKHNTDALSNVNNAIPLPDGWGPQKQIVSTPSVYDYLVDEAGNYLTDENGDRLIVSPDWSGIGGDLELPAAATALFIARKRDGTEVFISGTSTGLFRFNQSSYTWDNISSTTYASAVPWVIVQHGDLVLAQNGFNAEQMLDVEAGGLFADNTGAPICKAMAVSKDFVWRANIVSWASEGYTNEPRMVMCSAYNDPTDNVLQNRNFCDMQIFPTGTQVRAIVPFGDGCVVEMADARYGINVVMGDYTFNSFLIEEGRGTPSGYSVGLIGTNDYVIYRDDGFWRITGGSTKNIGDGKVNRTFLEDCDQDEREGIRACVDPENLVCWFSYTDMAADRKMIGYHYLLDEWTMSDADVVVSAPARTFVYGSTITTAGQLRFASIASTGILGFQVGDNAAAAFGTNEVLHNKDRSFVNGLKLITDAPTYSAVITTRDTLGGSTRARSAATPSSRSGLVPARADGRTHKYDFTIAAATNWTTATVVDVDVKASGRS